MAHYDVDVYCSKRKKYLYSYYMGDKDPHPGNNYCEKCLKKRSQDEVNKFKPKPKTPPKK